MLVIGVSVFGGRTWPLKFGGGFATRSWIRGLSDEGFWRSQKRVGRWIWRGFWLVNESESESVEGLVSGVLMGERGFCYSCDRLWMRGEVIVNGCAKYTVLRLHCVSQQNKIDSMTALCQE